MNTFHWNGIKNGALVDGVIEAQDKDEILKYLKTKNIIVTNLQTKKKGLLNNLNIQFCKTVTSKELMSFTKNFSVMCKGGLSIIKTIEIMNNQQKNVFFKNILKNIKKDLESGESLSRSFGKFPKVFNILYVNLLNAGEISGRLEFFLDKLAKNIEKNEKRKLKLKKGTLYPGILILAAISVITLMIIFVIPVFMKIYKNVNSDLPYLTNLLIEISNFIQDPFKGGLLLLCILFGLIIFKFTLKFNKSLLEGFHKQLLKLPILGDILLKDILYKLFLIKGDLIGAGVSLVESIDIAKESTSNLHIKNILERVKNGIICGQPFSQLLNKEPVFPHFISEMTVVAEETGNIEEMFNFMADCFEEEFNYSVEQFLELLEPFLVIVIGIIIGFILLALYLPVFKMGQII